MFQSLKDSDLEHFFTQYHIKLGHRSIIRAFWRTTQAQPDTQTQSNQGKHKGMMKFMLKRRFSQLEVRPH